MAGGRGAQRVRGCPVERGDKNRLEEPRCRFAGFIGQRSSGFLEFILDKSKSHCRCVGLFVIGRYVSWRVPMFKGNQQDPPSSILGVQPEKWSLATRSALRDRFKGRPTIRETGR